MKETICWAISLLERKTKDNIIVETLAIKPYVEYNMHKIKQQLLILCLKHFLIYSANSFLNF